MTPPIDPGDAANTLGQHMEVLVRIGSISVLAGILGGTFAFFSDAHRRKVPFGWKLLTYYGAKICSAFLAAYLALLVVPMFGLGTSVQAEQAIAILAAVMGGDFIGLLVRRVLGERRADSGPWDGKDRRESAQQ